MLKINIPFPYPFPQSSVSLGNVHQMTLQTTVTYKVFKANITQFCLLFSFLKVWNTPLRWVIIDSLTDTHVLGASGHNGIDPKTLTTSGAGFPVRDL